jgi:hypothetical protein
MFAIEMVRSALQNPAIPICYNLRGLWMHMDMQMGDARYKSVQLLFKIHDAPSQVEAECNISSEDGAWVRGSCTITLIDLEPTVAWSFNCEVRDNQIVAILN